MAQFEIHVGDGNLTRNENLWSQFTQEHVIVSTYPLGLWMLQNWWRLLYEPLPLGRSPDIHWRMAHELGAANHGFVWPKIILASDSENVKIWSSPSSNQDSGQSARYLNGLDHPVSIPIPAFRDAIFDFVSMIERRLSAHDVHSSNLSELFKVIKEEEQERKG